MPEFKLKKWVAAGLIVSMPYAGMVNAAGLGGMNVLSQIGQPFSAEIELVNVSKEELATLSATLAAPNAYRAANLQFNPALNSMRLAVERRADGRPFIRVTSSRPVAEPFLDILIELSWQGGRIVREYSALLDPPGLEIPAPVVTAPVVAAPATKPAPAGKAPAAVATPAPAAAAPAARPAPAPVAKPESASRPITGSEYAVKQGDTLGQIAAGLKPEGISLDQMMIGLLRANPDAFINNNINLVKAGRILKAPERDQLAAIVPGEASQQVRAQATDWNSYRAKVADTAPAATEAAPATKGKITARVEDKVAPGAKDVVVISKGEATKGKDGKAGVDRVRALEEDVAAKDKALAEAKDRVAALEKTVEQMKKLAEIKSPAMAAAQPAGKGDAKADAKAAPKPEPKAEPVRKAEAPKAEPTKAEPPKAEPAKAEPPKAETPKAEPAKADGAKPDEKAAVAEAPKPDPAPTPKAAPPVPSTPPVPKAAAKAAPPQEPGIMDAVMENILPIGGGAALAGLAGFWAFRRRKKGAAVADEEPTFAKTEAIPRSAVAASAAAPVASAPAVAAALEPAATDLSDVVDPIEEAQVYIDHGRDNQAEEILKEAMGKFPQRQDVQLKLLEVYAARGDKGAFNTLAKDFNKLTGGAGDNWERVAGMGHALDPANALYPSTSEAVNLRGADDGASAGVDLDLGGEDNLSTTTDILLEDQGATDDAGMDKTMVMMTPPADADAEAVAPAAVPALPEFNLDLPDTSAPAAESVDLDKTLNNMMDFNLDLNALDNPSSSSAEPAAAAPAAGNGMDFDLSDISLNLDDKPAAAGAQAGGEKDAHWNDVQQKFDLARAYQDMGDKDGAKEILREVLSEGDDAQKAEAQKLMDTLK